MKIMIIAASDLPIPAYKGGATETLVSDLLDRDKVKMNPQMEIVVYSHCLGTDFKDGNVQYHYLKKTLFQRMHFLFFLFLRILSRKRRNIPDIFPKQISRYENFEDYDLIVLEGNKDQVSSLRKMYSGLLVLHIHTVMTLTINTYQAKKIVDNCDYILANSAFAKRKMLGIDPSATDKFIEWSNCIDAKVYSVPDLAKKEQLRSKYSISEQDFVVVYCGRLEEGKGVLELIKAFKMAKVDAKLMVIGASWFSDNRTTKYIKKLKKESEEISDKLIFTGYVEHKELPAYYSLASIAVMPSIYEEAAGLVALEAQASGLPTIVSDIGGIPEFINQFSELKVSVDKDFIERISRLIIRLKNDREFYELEKEKALKNVMKHDMAYYEENFLKIIEKIHDNKYGDN